jgi:hypothetical protein
VCDYFVNYDNVVNGIIMSVFISRGLVGVLSVAQQQQAATTAASSSGRG